jgi:hypothetical protein
MKDTVFLAVKPQVVTHWKHMMSSLQSPTGYCYVRVEVFTAVTMKNVVFFYMKLHVVPRWKHITSPLPIPTG